jgi:hypothetical protein
MGKHFQTVWLPIIASTIISFGGWVMTTGAYKEKIDTHGENIKKIWVQTAEAREMTIKHETIIPTVQKDISDLKMDVKDIQKDIKEILKVVKS